MKSDASLASWAVPYNQIKAKYVFMLISRRLKLDEMADVVIGYADPKSKAWDAAMAPAKSIPMNLMMLYMSGNSVQIFSMMAVYMTVVNPLKAITTVNAVFAPYRNPKRSVLPQMLLFIACQLACTCVGLYKCWSMGLLPTEASDWLAWHTTPQASEYTATLA